MSLQLWLYANAIKLEIFLMTSLERNLFYNYGNNCSSNVATNPYPREIRFNGYGYYAGWIYYHWPCVEIEFLVLVSLAFKIFSFYILSLPFENICTFAETKKSNVDPYTPTKISTFPPPHNTKLRKLYKIPSNKTNRMFFVSISKRLELLLNQLPSDALLLLLSKSGGGRKRLG